MSKELDEAWVTIYHYNDELIHDMGSEYVENPLSEELDIVNNALLELKAIKETKPSEALEIFSKVDNVRLLFTNEERNTIKQALIKAQEQEKVLNIIKEKRVDYDHEEELTQEEFVLLKRWLK